jgi:predicted transcriptional regulator YheO
MKEKPRRPCPEILKPFIGLTKALGAMLGPDYEIVLHDTTKGAHSVVEICNGELTGRTKDDPLTDFGEILLKPGAYEGIDYIANYSSFAVNGRPMRSSVVIIRDGNKGVAGFLCINYDLSRASMLKALADFLTEVHPLDSSLGGAELLVSKPDEHMRLLLAEALEARAGVPLRYATRKERLDILSRLDELGFFAYKGSMDIIAAETGKSQYTLYNDLRAIRERG